MGENTDRREHERAPKVDEGESDGSVADGESNGKADLTRRRALRTGSLAAAGGLFGVAGPWLDGAAAACDRPDEVRHLDYDDYESWDDVYRLSNGDGDNLDFVSSPTFSGDTALQVRIREGDHWGASTHHAFDDGLFEFGGRVRFALDTGWTMDGRELANCRLWNCAMALGEGSAGGGIPDGTNGWSNRMYVTSRGAGSDGPFYLLSNTYHMDHDGHGDHDYLLDGEEYAVGSPEIEPGVWYEFEYYVCVNTTTDGIANGDGIVRYWIDGELVYERENFRFTEDHGDNVIETTGPAGHYGGRYEAPRNLYAYYDDHSMALNGELEFDSCR